MGLTDEERKSIVVFRLQKANETFAEISVLIENKFYRTAANRLYYACYYAASALMIKDNHDTHTHSGAKTVLGLFYVKEGIIENSFAKLYGNLFNLRQTGDYEDWIMIEEDDIKPLVEPAKKFIETIEKLINENS